MRNCIAVTVSSKFPEAARLLPLLFSYQQTRQLSQLGEEEDVGGVVITGYSQYPGKS